MSLKLTRSEVKGVRLMAFEMEARSRAGREEGGVEGGRGGGGEEGGEARGGEQLLVFDIVMQVVEGGGGTKGAKSSPGEWGFVPVSVKLKRVFGDTMTLSKLAIAEMLGNSTSVVPLGFESEDQGVAGQAAQQ